MKLSRYTLKQITSEKLVLPIGEAFELPEKVLQFGTGKLLRGLADYFIDAANKVGIFNGRIVLVKSTAGGDIAAYNNQNGLYTLCIRGIQSGNKVEENIVCAAISRVLNARDEWKEILKCAHNEDFKIIISNTTEIGIQLLKEDIRKNPPVSFPGKLLSFLYERFTAFKGKKESGFVIIPTELIPENGKKLESIVIELAHLNFPEDEFLEWLENSNYFCNSLVDRIVTGMPPKEIRDVLENEFGYNDDLLTVAEVYSLWAIEGDEKIKNILSFAETNAGVIIEPNINLHRELKLRLLNGTHTLVCGIAFLSGYETVYQTMQDQLTSSLIEYIMRSEIAPFIPYQIDDKTKALFITNVLDRFRNPHINHYWKDITLNYSSKIQLRCIAVLLKHYKKDEAPPQLFALAFASYFYFMKAVKQTGNNFFGEFNGKDYLIMDDQAGRFYVLWMEKSPEQIVEEILSDISLWGHDLSQLNGFEQEVINNLNAILKYGMKSTLENVSKKISGIN